MKRRLKIYFVHSLKYDYNNMLYRDLLTDSVLNKSVDMTVLLGSKALSPAPQHFAAAQFNNGETQPMDLIIKQTTPRSLDAGHYEGRLNIALTQSTNT